MKKYIGYGILIILIGGIAGFIIWTQIYYSAKTGYLEQINSNPGLTITEDRHHITITPRGGDTTHTILFYPGAKVDPHAYMYKLGSIALTHNLTVIIDKPFLRLQIFGINNADLFAGDHLIIAGHSLGGAMACEYVKSHPDRIAGMILMGAYCDSDISSFTGISTLLFAASNDGLIAPEKIKSYDYNLPPSHTVYILTGAIHAQYGNYGAQDGDGVNSISDDEVLQQLNHEIGKFISTIESI